MVHSLAIYREALRDASVSIPSAAAVDVPEGTNTWKKSAPFSEQDIRGMMQAGIASRKLLPFETASFSSNLVPANEAQGKCIAEGRVPPDGNPRDIELKTNHLGLHWIELSDGLDSSSIEWPEGMKFTAELTSAPLNDIGEQLYYFYVPKGTKVVGGYAAGLEGVLIDPEGKTVQQFAKDANYFHVPVDAKLAGKLWSMRIRTYDSTLLLITVPSVIARSSEQLLLPREVVEADSK